MDNLTNCDEAILGFELARGGVKLPRVLRVPPSVSVGGVPPPLPPAGYTVDPAPSDLDRALVGRRILYWWGENGWQLGCIAESSRVTLDAGFSVRLLLVLSGAAHTLLDAASYSSYLGGAVPCCPC